MNAATDNTIMRRISISLELIAAVRQRKRFQ